MKKRIVVLVAFMLFFTRCGVQDEEGLGSSPSSEEQRIVPLAENNALIFLEELAKDKVMPDGKDYGDLTKNIRNGLIKMATLFMRFCQNLMNGRKQQPLRIGMIYVRFQRKSICEVFFFAI